MFVQFVQVELCGRSSNDGVDWMGSFWARRSGSYYDRQVWLAISESSSASEGFACFEFQFSFWEGADILFRKDILFYSGGFFSGRQQTTFGSHRAIHNAQQRNRPLKLITWELLM